MNIGRVLGFVYSYKRNTRHSVQKCLIVRALIVNLEDQTIRKSDTNKKEEVNLCRIMWQTNKE